MSKRIIDARVRQKAAPLEEWNNSDLDSLDGEQLFVRSDVDDAVIGFKLGAKNKKFSELPYPDFTVRGKVSPSSTWTGRQSGIYIPTTNGNYNGVQVNLTEGYQVLYWDGSTIEKVVYPNDYVGVVFGGVVDDTYDLSNPTEPIWYIASPGTYNTVPPITLTENSILTWDGQSWSHIPFELEVRGEFLVADNVQEVRNITPQVASLLVNGTYKGVTVLGYYEPNDTPSEINYYVSDTLLTDDGGSVLEVVGIKLEHEFESIVDVSYFGARVQNEDNKRFIQNAINYTKKFENKEVRIEKKYYASNLLIDNRVKLNGAGKLAMLDINYQVVQNPVTANDALFTPTDSLDNYEINDVLIFKGAAEDIVVVTGKTGSQLTVAPLIFFYSVNDTHTGFKYNQPVGATYYKSQQILWVTDSLTEDNSRINIVNGVNIDLDFTGSRSVNYDLNSLYQLTTGAIWCFGTSHANITNSSFTDFDTTPVYFYGYNSFQKFKANKVKDVGYTMPLSWEAQRRDATSGITLHWSQRFPAGDPRHNDNVSVNYEISGNNFEHCWNGGVFLSATKTGKVFGNTVDGYVSHGICVYGGDFGIDSYGVRVYDNDILNGDTTGETGVLGAGIWISVITLGTKIYNNTINGCDIGVSCNFAQFSSIYDNTIENCKKSYIKLTGYVRNTTFKNNNVFVSPNTDTSATIVDIDSSLSSTPNENLIFQSNNYVVRSGWLGKPIYNLKKIGGLFLQDETPIGSGNYMVNVGYLSGGVTVYDKPVLSRVNVRGISGSGATISNSNRIEVIEKSNILTTNADFLGDYSYQGSKVIRESNAASQATKGVVNQARPVPNGSSIDTLLGALRDSGQLAP